LEERKMRKLVVLIVMVITSFAFATETWHIGGSAGGTIYVKADNVVFPNATNSPMHESWNLVDQYIDGVLNPHFLGTSSSYDPGFYGKFIMYDMGEFYVDVGAKVGIGMGTGNGTLWSGGNVTGGNDWGRVVINGELIVNTFRHWKGGGYSYHIVEGDGILRANTWNIGIVDTGVNNVYASIEDNALAVIQNLKFEPTSASYVDITGGELLVKTAYLGTNVVTVDSLIGTWITNSTHEGLLVSTKNIGGVDYTSVTLLPEPATVALLGLGTLALLRRKA
jgi:hypothetical protein